MGTLGTSILTVWNLSLSDQESSGFLTPFNAADVQLYLGRILQPSSRTAVRDAANEVHSVPYPDAAILIIHRLLCEIYRDGCSTPELQHLALNECLIDRGCHPCLAMLELFVDDVLVTVVQADGLIV